MSNIEKVANMSPLDLFLLTGAAGAGGYGTLQLLKDMLGGKQPAQVPGQALDVHIPTQKKKEEVPAHMATYDAVEPMGMSSVKHANEDQSNALMQFLTQPTDRLSGMVTGMMGLPLGVMGAKGLYDHLRGNQMQAKLDAEKKRYEEALYRAKYGEASTPVLDDFCEKVADWFDRGLNADAVENFQKTVPHINPVTAVGNAASGGMIDAGKDTWMTGAALTTALTMAALAAQRRNKEKKEQSMGYPTRVVLQ